MGIIVSKPTPLVLASQSAARISLLKGAGLPFTAEAARVDERAAEAPLLAQGVSPRDLAMALAEAKALDVAGRHPEALVIGGDQTLELDGTRFTKPESVAAARRQLAQLSGRTHRLHSAVVVAQGDVIAWRHVDSATMTMRALDLRAIDAYLAVAGDKVMGSVGAYQLEGPGVRLFDKIDGDFFTILGMPLLPLLAYLRQAGVITW
jgi:septum formation protein